MHGSLNIKVNKHRGQNASRKKNTVVNMAFEKRKAAISVHETVRKLKILIKLNIFEQISLYFVQHSRLNYCAVASGYDVVKETKLDPKPNFRSIISTGDKSLRPI
jgi:hypothetical protein